MNRNHQNEGMRYPSIDQLISKTKDTEGRTSKYRLVIGVAERAKEIDKTKKTYLEETKNKKSIGIALEEIYAEKILVKDSKENGDS